MQGDPWWVALGLKLPDLVAGFAGGVVNAFVFKRTDPWAVVGSVVVGMLTANYLGETAAASTGLKLGAAAFIVGLGGMMICQGVLEGLKRWRLPIPGGSDDKSGN